MKKCTRCNETKEHSGFSKNKNAKDGFQSHCKSCQALHYVENKAVANARNKAWRVNNKERERIQKQEYYIANKDAIKIRNALWHQQNPDKYRERVARRRATKANATPSWSNSADIRKIYSLATWMSDLYQTPFEVDHIIPLNGKTVCGLHVESNLQVIPRYENRSKQNKLIEELL